MKKLLSVAAILIALVCVLTISACDGGDSTQTPNGTTPGGTAESETDEKETAESETNDHVHAFGEWKVISEPTCTELGSQERICSCGETEIKSIDKLGHAEVVDPAVAPTCTEEGKTEGKHCSRCSAVLVAQEIVPISHNWATAYEYDQEKHWKRCVLCNDTTPNEVHVLESDGWCQICKLPVPSTPGVMYDLSGDGSYADVIGYNGSATKVKIAAEYEGVPVTGIYDEAFKNANITAVVIPDSVVSIGYEAFEDCDSLTTVTIGDSVTSIGADAFMYCDSLTAVTIGDSVTSIGSYAFYGCTSLTGVYITDVAAWCSIDFKGGYPSNPLYYAKNLYLNGALVTAITIPDSVTSIGEYAFYGCSSLTNVTVGDSVTSIGDEAFGGCNSALYTEYEFGKYVKSGENPYAVLIAVTNKNMSSYTIHEDTRHIANSVFSGCSRLASITIPDSVTSIGYEAFAYCSGLAAVTIGDSVTSIGPRAFSGCSSFTSITIPDSVTSIGHFAFYGCSGLTAVTIPDSVVSIGSRAFEGCSGLTAVTIGDSVTSIGSRAFSGCESLTSITIPDSVTSIGEDAFYWCNSLATVYYGGSEAQWQNVAGRDNLEWYADEIVYNFTGA